MSNSLEKVDKNFNVKGLDAQDIELYDVRNKPFQLYGLYRPESEDVFKRLPDDIAAKTSEGVAMLALNTAGARVRFSTDSRYVGIKAVMPSITRMPHMTLAGSAGFDLYEDTEGTSIYLGTFMPPYNMTEGYDSVIYLNKEEEYVEEYRKKRSFTVHFPLYSNVKNLYIALEKDSYVGEGLSYVDKKPILIYGSSITQGGCASRPGNCYTNLLSMKLNMDHINLGFSGGAKAEKAICEYMATMDFSAFICDYDNNAPNVEHLQKTHEKLYLTIREKHKKTPILLMSRPNFDKDKQDGAKRREVVYMTYINGRMRGDSNLYFLDGESLFMKDYRDACTVDGSHPNDLGFVRMTESILILAKRDGGNWLFGDV